MATRFIRLTDRSLFSGALVLALLAVLAIPGQTLSAQEAGADEDVTYTRDSHLLSSRTARSVTVRRR
ncbi:MAG: hypothetical protein Ct9H300mP15_20670 [Gemmatimonadota bacterium]|nr:MAG: hypothetical protein Ct9H300mP15_20670 [Gemmatimonadota bacterium]